ncbi:MAG: hypothetical protein K0R50_2679 [Eubacterium sp.]|nr:hypothetical protein [Eubacterium sp.]
MCLPPENQSGTKANKISPAPVEARDIHYLVITIVLNFYVKPVFEL